MKKFKILISLMALALPLSISFLSNKNEKRVDAEDNKVFLAIDGGDGIGYISNDVKNFYASECGMYTSFKLDTKLESNVFSLFKGMGDTYEDSIKKIIILDEIVIRDASHFFSNLPVLEEIQNLTNLKTWGSIDFSEMFANCPNLKTADFSNFDTSNATNFKQMFSNTGFESLDLSSFNTPSVTDYSEMFRNCKELQSLNLSSFNTKNATHMEHMFQNCDSLQALDISNFDLSNKPNVENMFADTIPDIIVAPKVVPGYPFKLSFSLEQFSDEIPYYYDEKLNNFAFCEPSNTSLTYYSYNVKNIVVKLAEGFNHLFEKEQYKNIDRMIAIWNEFPDFAIPSDSLGNYVRKILKSCDANCPIESVGDCVELYEFIYTNYYGALVNNGGDFLDRCPNAGNKDGLAHIGINTGTKTAYLASFDTYEILSSNVKWSINLKSTSIDNSIFSTNSYTNYDSIENVVIQDEIEIPNAVNFFKGLSSLSSIEGIENLDTSSSIALDSMFEGCSNLETLDLSGLDATLAQSTTKMFKDCSNLAIVDLSISNTGNLKRIDEMFSGCSRLISIDLSKLDFKNVNLALNFLDKTSFFYIKTPKVMPINSCEMSLFIPQGEQNYYFYDTLFNTYSSLPNDKTSFLLISEAGKRLLGSFCNDFIKECEYNCMKDGSTSETSLINLWDNQSKDFTTHVTNSVHNQLLPFFMQDNSTSIYEPLKDFSERYDYIYGKYQALLDNYGGDFAFRNEIINLNKISFSGNNTKTNISEQNNSYLIAIFVISTAIIFAVAYKIQISKQ